MGIDYYGALQVQRNATDLEIKKAFRDLALEFNPVKLENSSSKRVFALICEAYDVLSNPCHRAIFDQFGEEGLKGGVVQLDGFTSPYHYHGEPMRTYREFFGTTFPYANLVDCLQKSVCEGTMKRRKQAPINHTLYLTLHEIFFGGIKKMKIHHLVYINDEKNKTEVKEKILTIPIKPGIRSGTKITFPEEGDQSPDKIPADVIFVVEERPHDSFTREDDNLTMRYDVTLEEALMGTVVTVNTIDRRTIRVPITDVIFPGYEKIVENEGMPILENGSSKGNLIIRFNISFPSYLPQACKDWLRKGFQLAKIGGGINQYETINKLVLADKILRVDLNEQDID